MPAITILLKLYLLAAIWEEPPPALLRAKVFVVYFLHLNSAMDEVLNNY